MYNLARPVVNFRKLNTGLREDGRMSSILELHDSKHGSRSTLPGWSVLVRLRYRPVHDLDPLHTTPPLDASHLVLG